MLKQLTRAALAALALSIATPAFADGPGAAGPDVAAPPTGAAAPSSQTGAAPEGRTGLIPLGDGALTLNVPAGYRFYSAEQAHAYLQRNNAPAPSGAVFGLLARAGDDIRQPGVWATVISYDAIGYVSPETAAGLSDANLEADVRSARTAQSRAFEGFAAAPSFETETPYVVWAERVAAPGSQGAQGPDLRYEQRILARQGVACMTSIGSADQMTEIAEASDDLRAMLSFPEGQRHADFQPASDQVSAFSVPGLVTGVAAQPQALAEGAGGEGQTAFGGLSGWFPWVALGVVLLAGGGYLLMRRRSGDDDEDASESA